MEVEREKGDSSFYDKRVCAPAFDTVFNTSGVHFQCFV